jgi:hypothetical protein
MSAQKQAKARGATLALTIAGEKLTTVLRLLRTNLISR